MPTRSDLPSLQDPSAGDVREYLLAHPDFFDDHPDLLAALVPPMSRSGEEGVRDFQHYMLAKLQNDMNALREEQDDLMDLMQEQMQRQNRFNAAMMALLDAGGFEQVLRLIGQDFMTILDQEGVGFILEAGGWLDQGDYAGLRIVQPGTVGRWLGQRDILLEEVTEGARDLYGEASARVRSQALVKLVIKEGLPPGLLALGHADPMHYATGLATEQVECLASVIERMMRRWLIG